MRPIRLEAPSAPEYVKVGAWAQRNGASDLFVHQMVPALIRVAERHGIDPLGTVAQSAKETAFGNFGGIVKPWFHNTCGLKVRHNRKVPEPYDHAMFGSWEAGATAHVMHLVGYSAKGGETRPELYMVDPRYELVYRAVEYWEDLGGLWAPSPTYGAEIVDMVEAM